MKNRIILYLLFVSTVALTGCKVLQPNSMFKTESGYNYANDNEEQTEYVIKPYDKLNIRVFTNGGNDLVNIGGQNTTMLNQTMQTPYMVEHNGEVKVPSLGRVKISGLTIKEAENFLEEKYSQYYNNPFVLVNVTNRRVILFPSGSSSGTILPIENEHFTLVEAIAAAGGINDFSKSYRIKLIRGELSNPQIFMFDVSSMEEIKKANLVLQANDIIYIENRPRYISRVLTEVGPYIGLLNTAILVVVTVNSFNKK